MFSKKEISTFLKLSKKAKNPKKGLPQGVFDAISQLHKVVWEKIHKIVNSNKKPRLKWP